MTLARLTMNRSLASLVWACAAVRKLVLRLAKPPKLRAASPLLLPLPRILLDNPRGFPCFAMVSLKRTSALDSLVESTSC